MGKRLRQPGRWGPPQIRRQGPARAARPARFPDHSAGAGPAPRAPSKEQIMEKNNFFVAV